MIKDMVSVIVPTHNRASSVARALRSILDQSYPLIEIIVIANGCDDHSQEVIKDFESKHQNIVFLNFTETLGGAKARNIGIDKAGGEYIAFLDDDDTWHPDKLTAQVQLLNQLNCAIVGSNYFYVYNNNTHRSKIIENSLIEPKDLYYENNLGSFSLCLSKKIYIGKSRINEDLDALQDWDLWLKILSNVKLPAVISTDYHTYICFTGDRISSNYHKLVQAQQVFLAYWQNNLDLSSINYHKMRTRCLQLKISPSNNFYRYLINLPLVIRALFYSPYRYNIKKYIHYLLLPIMNIETVRAKFSKKICTK